MLLMAQGSLTGKQPQRNFTHPITAHDQRADRAKLVTR